MVRIKILKISRKETTEDIPKDPIACRYTDIEFQEISKEKQAKMQDILETMCERYLFNSFNLIGGVIEYALAKNISFAKSINKVDTKKLLNSDEGTTCITLSEFLKQAFKKLDIKSYIIPFTATGLINKAGNKYVDIGHTSVCVKEIINNRHTYAIYDPGMFIPKPFLLIKNSTSNTINVRQKTFCMHYVKDDLLHNYKYKTTFKKETKKLSEVAFFNPEIELLNPYQTLARDYLRAAAKIKVAKLDRRGNLLSCITANVIKNEVACIYGKLHMKYTFKEYLSSTSKIVEQICENMNIDYAMLNNTLIRVIKYRQRIITELLAPSVRKELKFNI